MKLKVTLAAVLMILLFGANGFSQVTKLTVGVDGFTCSLCAKGVEAQFKSLDFVKSVKTDLKNTLFILTLNSDPPINVIKIRDAVTDGGFTLRDVKIEATGTVRGDANSGYIFIAPNAPEIHLKNLKTELSEGDKITIKGLVNVNENYISVSSLKKI